VNLAVFVPFVVPPILKACGVHQDTIHNALILITGLFVAQKH
jgi:hypothetical protein